jgi:hypothetical protein
MGAQFTSGQIRRSIQRFNDYSSDLIHSDMNSFEDRLNMFFNFCLTDEVFAVFHIQLISVEGIDFNQWLSKIQPRVGGMAGSGRLLFPTNVEQRLSVMYQLLHCVQEGRVPFLDFATNFFALGTTQITAYINAFNKAVTVPLVRELSYRLEDMLDSLPDDQSERVPASAIQIIHNAQNVIQQTASGNHIAQTANVTANSEIEELFKKLKLSIQESIPPSDQQEPLEIVEAAREEAISQNPKPSALKALFAALPPINSVLSITVSIMRLLGHG